MTDRRESKDLPEPPEPLPVPVVDSHCHLEVAEDRTGLGPADAIASAAAVGVSRIVQIGCDVASSRWAVEAAARFPSVVAAVALHPNDAARMSTEELTAGLAEIARLAGQPGVRALGETGLDRYRTRDEDGLTAQRESFAAHLAIARERDKSVVVHDRDAHADILDVLDAEGAPDRLIMHCFSGDAAFAKECLDRGAYLSFAGTVTFKNAADLREALALTPLDRVLVETDAPFLTPQPHRGRPNASYLIPHTARVMAEVLKRGIDEVCQALSDNAELAFGGAWPSAEPPAVSAAVPDQER